MKMCYFWVNIVKINKNWLFSKIVWGGVSWLLNPMRKLFLAHGKKKVGPPWPTAFFTYMFNIDSFYNIQYLSRVSDVLILTVHM
jgi:hypothetical protein